MPFYPAQQCRRCYQQPDGSPQRPVPVPRQQAESNCSHNHALPGSDSGSDCPCSKMDVCKHHRTLPEDPAIAMSYVPWQRWANLSNQSQALQQGTIFADLNKPFSGKGGSCR